MEHPILFLCLILEKLGLPSGWHYYEEAEKYGILAQIFAPHMVHSYFVIGIIIILALIARSKKDFIPGAFQNVCEFVLESIYNFTKSNLPHDKFEKLVPTVFPLITAYAFYIL
ncbi:MAG: ATP synthase F0 subunit A, partial [Caldimicrobium sp.]